MLNLSSGLVQCCSRNQSTPKDILNRITRFGLVAERLATVTIENCDGVDLIERLPLDQHDLIYADPSYLRSTRTSNGVDYEHELDVDDHHRLLSVLTGTPATVILSGYPSDLYDNTLDGWETVDWNVIAATTNVRGNHSRRGRVERVWINRPLRFQRLFV